MKRATKPNQRRTGNKTKTAADERDFEFQGEPGHLVRRLHQIATSIFLEQSKALDITPIQYAALNAIGRHPRFDQRQIARLIAVDRTTINVVTKRLAENDWVVRQKNGVRLELTLTRAGAAILKQLMAHTVNHGEELLAPLTLTERQQFLKYLHRLVDGNNTLSRVPLLKAGEK